MRAAIKNNDIPNNSRYRFAAIKKRLPNISGPLGTNKYFVIVLVSTIPMVSSMICATCVLISGAFLSKMTLSVWNHFLQSMSPLISMPGKTLCSSFTQAYSLSIVSLLATSSSTINGAPILFSVVDRGEGVNARTEELPIRTPPIGARSGPCRWVAELRSNRTGQTSSVSDNFS